MNQTNLDDLERRREILRLDTEGLFGTHVWIDDPDLETPRTVIARTSPRQIYESTRLMVEYRDTFYGRNGTDPLR